MPKKSWPEFFFYIARIFILLILLAVVLPKLVSVCSLWISSQAQDERQPSGNPVRVEEPSLSRFVLQLFPNTSRH
ncbi:hypothetical protein [Desulfitobacterium sp.]|uniref:hypothetical protein n=1 Tax=Desulfitobacterium sp. TaxID=49981 RepID=UPI002CAC0A6D|nr:hypothetical protein [Desulfitobacterium sp.]HVJ48414.1 hypothetical protein [Desulfitobacterium sp.]